MSELPNQVARLRADGLGNPQKGMKADPLLATLNFADVNRVKVGFFSQPFLTQSRLDAMLADGIA